MDLHAAQAALESSIRKHLTIVEGFEDHRASAERQYTVLMSLEKDLPHGHILIHIDYKQNPTVPVGPEEPGTRWFATARRGVIVLGAHVVMHLPTSTPAAPCTFGLRYTLRVCSEREFLFCRRQGFFFQKILGVREHRVNTG